ncbi:hypothetical protein GCU49_20445 [Modestobacter roseus]|nr:hypothetical protein [Modestobacter roseus]
MWATPGATVTESDQRDACLADIRARGWAAECGELHDRVGCSVAAVRSRAGELVAGVVLSTSSAVPETPTRVEQCTHTLAKLLV